MSKRKKNQTQLVEAIIDIEDKEQLSIIYDITKKNVFISAMKQFYEKKVQIIAGPIIILVGFILKQYTNMNIISNILMIAGMFYTIFPHIILLGNLTAVKAQKINMSICKDGLHISNMLTKNESLSVLEYKDIYDIEQDNHYVRIIPGGNNVTALNSIPIPIEHVKEGNLEAFIETLRAIIKEQGNGKEQEEKRLVNGKIILSYTLSENQYKEIYTKEYFKRKIQIIYIIVFGIIALTAVFINITLAIVSAIVCLFYIIYPRIMYRLNIKEHIGQVIIRDCGDGYLSIIGESVKVKLRPDKIKVVYDDKYIKYYIPIRKKYFRYIDKENCDDMQLNNFFRIIGYKK